MGKQKFGFMIGIFDVLSLKIREQIKKESQNYEYFAIGVYTNEFLTNKLMTSSMKTTEQRIEIAEQLDGVDFAFPVETKESNEVKYEIERAFKEYLHTEEEENKKKFKVGIIIGSFDLLHSGHIENIKMAKAQCEKLAAVVKTDERIIKNKGKTPIQSSVERANILSELKSVDHIFYMDLETTRTDLINQISEYYCVDKSDMAMIFGSDLKEKEQQHIDELKDINVVYTYRDRDKMKTISSSYYQEKCKLNNKKLSDLEQIEEEHNI